MAGNYTRIPQTMRHINTNQSLGVRVEAVPRSGSTSNFDSRINPFGPGCQVRLN